MKRRSPYRALYTTSLVRTIRRRVKKLLLTDNDLLLLLFSDGFLMWETQHVASLTMVYSRLPKLSLISSRQVCARKRAVTPTVFKWTGEIMHVWFNRKTLSTDLNLETEKLLSIVQESLQVSDFVSNYRRVSFVCKYWVIGTECNNTRSNRLNIPI